MQIWTCQEILNLYPPSTFKWAIKIGTLRIRPFTEEDIRTFPPTVDLEGRPVVAEIGRCLCVGIEGEMFTCSLRSLEQDRELVNPYRPPDAEGFREYRMKNPKPIQYIILNFPFQIRTSNDDVWISQPDGGVITWNGKTGTDCSMRIIKTAVFLKTYKLLT